MHARYNTDHKFGLRLKSAMVEADLDTKQVAQAIGRSTETVRRYIRGQVPDRLVMEKWAELTGKSVDYFMTGENSIEGGSPVTNQLPHQEHPGVEVLAADAKLMASLEVTPEELQELRALISPRGPISDLASALRFLEALRLQRPAAAHR